MTSILIAPHMMSGSKFLQRIASKTLDLRIRRRIRLDHAPDLTIEVPHAFVLPVLQNDFHAPGAFFIKVDFRSEYIMSLENIVRVIGREFLFEYLFAFWILENQSAFVLAPLKRCSKSDNPVAFHERGKLLDFKDIEQAVHIEMAFIVVFRLVAEKDISAVKVLHELPHDSKSQASTDNRQLPAINMNVTAFMLLSTVIATIRRIVKNGPVVSQPRALLQWKQQVRKCRE